MHLVVVSLKQDEYVLCSGLSP